MNEERLQFCTECREETTYEIRFVPYKKNIRNKEYEFIISEAVCKKCGASVYIPGLMDKNAKEIEEQYRVQENIVSVAEIRNLMQLYKIGKKPLSLALGFGEITISRYLSGQVPSKTYSDVIKNALESPGFMKKKLNENAEKIGEAAYKKAMNAVKEMEPLFALSEKMLLTISYVFKKAGEITPLALQKMLYYIQGIYMVLYKKELFVEECEAWVHGPVFRDVYDVFKSFKYNPIDDIRFSMFQNRFLELTDEERGVIDLVVESFGMYSGKTLELITHEEKPWCNARKNYLHGEASKELIPKALIESYFLEIAQTYEIDKIDGIKSYINSKLSKLRA